jgi:glutamate--cysteine ligase
LSQLVASDIPSPPVENRDDLVRYIEQGCKPAVDWRIGTEHEKFAYRRSDLRSVPYDGPDGIRAILDGLTRFGWSPIREGDNVIALSLDGQSVSLEPGGQLELSGAPLKDLHQTCHEVNTHLAQAKAVGDELGVSFLGLGYQPKWRYEDTPVMPKGRYGIMRAYMPKKGSLGLDMMFRTCTVQVNLDYASESDMVRKLRTSLKLQPVATALFANSPFREGAPNGYLSFRAHVWTDTDPDRTGFLPFAFEGGMGFERYVDYALDVPMYFVYRDGYIDASGQSFRDFLDGRLPALPGEKPTVKDWENHLTTLFPEVRLKRFIELRGADGGPWRRLCALPALWVGLLYESGALDAATALCRDWSHADVVALHADVTRRGLNAEIRGRTVRDVALEVVAIATEGLRRRGVHNTSGDDESHFVDTLRTIADSGVTPAEELLQAYRTRWNGSVDPVFTDYAY